jgi:hypothetical protein
MLRKLRDDWTAGRNGRASWREFHDRVLSDGSPPIPLVRTELLGANAVLRSDKDHEASRQTGRSPLLPQPSGSMPIQ